MRGTCEASDQAAVLQLLLRLRADRAAVIQEGGHAGADAFADLIGDGIGGEGLRDVRAAVLLVEGGLLGVDLALQLEVVDLLPAGGDAFLARQDPGAEAFTTPLVS